MQLLFSKIKEEMEKQTANLTDSITKAVLEKIDDKLKPIIKENLYMKNEIEKLNKKIKYLEREGKDNNLIFHGFEENIENKNLIETVTNTLKKSGFEICKQDINKAFRIGKPNEKARPVLINMLNGWKKTEILRNKKKLPKNIFVREDFSKEILEKRKELMPQLEKERRKGRIAFIKYDKLVVKGELGATRDKRKRDQSISPNLTTITESTPLKINKINAFERMYRNRSQPTSNINKE